MIQFNTRSKLSLISLILIILVSIQYLFHEDQDLPNITSTTNDNDDIHTNHVNSIDPYEFLHIIKNQDGTLTRIPEFYPNTPPSNSINSRSPSLSKDVLLDIEKNTWVRIYLPKKAIRKSKPMKKLPIVIFVHGGGFILFSASSPIFHDFCAELASQLGALVVSVEYRLAPEYRLPIAYDDVLDALIWVKERKEEWVTNYGNFSKCILVGQSAGGNIVYNVMLRAVDLVNELKPLTLMGSILIQPAFGGPNRSGSELRLAHDPLTPLVVGDLMWDLALPVGSGRDIEFCDPTVGGGSDKLDRVIDLGWWVVVTGCNGDPLIDRQVHTVNVLKKRGVNVKSLFAKGGYHSVSLIDPVAKRELLMYMNSIFREFW